MARDVSNATPNGRRFRLRAFRVIFVWLAVSAVLLAWELNRRNVFRPTVTFIVSVEGTPAADGYSAKLDGRPLICGDRAGLGRRTLVIEGRDTEPYQKKFTVWFGKNDLGELDLTRSKGALEIRAEPAAKEIRVAGTLFNGTNTNRVAMFPSLPVGEYQVTADFQHSAETRTVHVSRNETSRLDIKPAVGTLDLATEPSDAEFNLTAAQFGGLDLGGKAPAQLDQLPAGEYHLRVWRGDYVKELNLEIRTGETNQQNVVFEYGQVKLVTKPAGAGVFDGVAELGKTPKTIGELKPGQYEWRLQLDGYHPVVVEVSVTGKSEIVISTNLVSVRYSEAMEAARSLFESPGGDYSNALARVEEALHVEPADPDAMALKTKMQSALKAQETKLAEEKKRQEAEAKRPTDVAPDLAKAPPGAPLNSATRSAQTNRQQLAEQQFQKATEAVPDHGLFDLTVWRTSARFDKIRDALLKSIQRGRYKWKVLNETKSDETMSLFKLGAKGLVAIASDRFALVQLCQIDGEETEVRFKCWLYTTPVETGRLVPVHEQYYSTQGSWPANRWREDVAQKFREELAKDLGTELK